MDKKIKALFFDIDGTLVSFKSHRIPQSTVDALEQAKKNGVKVYISTGRPKQIINNLGQIEHLIDGYITANGARCFVEDTLVSQHTILIHMSRNVIGDLLQFITSIAHCYTYTCLLDDRDVVAAIAKRHGFFNVQAQIISHCLESLSLVGSTRRDVGKGRMPSAGSAVFERRHQERLLLHGAERSNLQDSLITNYLDGGMSVQNHKASLKERFEVMRSNYGIVTTVLVHTWFSAADDLPDGLQRKHALVDPVQMDDVSLLELRQ